MDQPDEISFREAWLKRLEREERDLGLSDGFGFVYGKFDTLFSADVAFLTLNPGRPPDGAVITREISNESGNAYQLDASKKSVTPLAGQFLQFASMIGRKPDQILTGVISPFRSANWGDLSRAQRKRSLQIGRDFWAQPLQRESLKLIVCCSNITADTVIELTGAHKIYDFRSGWANTIIRVYETRHKLILHLPHLSRYKLFSRKESRDIIERVFEERLQGYII